MNGKAPLFGRSSKKCPGAYNLHDDLRVVGANDEEHDENLNRVMCKLKESRLTLNYDKCEIGVSSMVYMGDVLSGEGLKISSERVKAIIEAPAPQNQSEVRVSLALCSFVQSSFRTSQPYRVHCGTSPAKTQGGSGDQKRPEKSFQEVKDGLTRTPVMAYFRQGTKTRLITDASPVGVGAILEQEQEDGSYVQTNLLC